MRLIFGDCMFDPDTREVFRAGSLQPVSPKAFALLETLIECRPKAVSRADIHARLWPATHVSEANLANLVPSCARPSATALENRASSAPWPGSATPSARRRNPTA